MYRTLHFTVFCETSMLPREVCAFVCKPGQASLKGTSVLPAGGGCVCICICERGGRHKQGGVQMDTLGSRSTSEWVTEGRAGG